MNSSATSQSTSYTNTAINGNSSNSTTSGSEGRRWREVAEVLPPISQLSAVIRIALANSLYSTLSVTVTCNRGIALAIVPAKSCLASTGFSVKIASSFASAGKGNRMFLLVEIWLIEIDADLAGSQIKTLLFIGNNRLYFCGKQSKSN